MLVGNTNIIPLPFELWLPDFTDFTLPRKPDGSCYTDKHDYDAYLDWLVDHLDANQFHLAPHQAEIISDPDKADWDSARLGLYFGVVAISEYYFFAEPQFAYPADFLNDPRPERVCNPKTVKIDSRLMMIDYDIPEEDRWALTLKQFLIFDCMCWEAMGEYDLKKLLLPPGTDIFSDIGWRPLLKAAISRTDVRSEKREALRRFHKEFAYMCQK
jgi:hypothetical protein